MPYGDGMSLPHDERAEQSLMALAALSPSYAERILPRVQADWFVDMRWREVFNGLSADGLAPRDHVLDLYGVDADPNRIDADIQRLVDCAERRALISAAHQIAAAAWNVDRPFSVGAARAVIDRVHHQPSHVSSVGYDIPELA